MPVENTDFFSSNSPIYLNQHVGFTSGGQLPKGWDTEKKYLYKAELEPGRTYCIYSEAICSELADILNISHVHYELVQTQVIFSGQAVPEIATVVRCANYLSEGITAISLYDLIQTSEYSKQEAREYLCRMNKEQYCKMLLFDFLIANTDRHYRNLGYLTDGINSQMIPLFDHDRALYSSRYNHEGSPFVPIDIWASEKLYQGPIYYLLHHAAKILPVCTLKSLCNWENLNDISPILNKYQDMPSQRRKSIQQMLQERLQYMFEELNSL